MAENTQHYHSEEVALSIPLEKNKNVSFFLKITGFFYPINEHLTLCLKLQIYLGYSSALLHF